LPASSTSRRAGARNQKCSAQAAEEDREPQVEVLEDRREDHSVLFEVEQAADVLALQLAVYE
jgi:hypothetical protein